MDSSLTDKLDISCEQVPCCSYCSKDKVLVKGKSYYHDCNKNCFRECKCCKQPFHDEKYFTYSETRFLRLDMNKENGNPLMTL